jgi:hypothetical protein
MRSPRCNGNRDTVVWCHSNHSQHGKGVGLKAHDIFGFYGCSGCHQWYDEISRYRGDPREIRDELFRWAHDRSLLRLLDKGVLT